MTHENIPGAWGVGPLDNDVAADWLESWAFEALPGWDVVEDTLSGAGSPGARHVVPTAWMVIAATAVIAASISDRFNPTENWVSTGKALGPAPAHLRKLGLARLNEVQSNSELADRWVAAGGFDAWTQELRTLKAALD